VENFLTWHFSIVQKQSKKYESLFVDSCGGKVQMLSILLKLSEVDVIFVHLMLFKMLPQNILHPI